MCSLRSGVDCSWNWPEQPVAVPVSVCESMFEKVWKQFFYRKTCTNKFTDFRPPLQVRAAKINFDHKSDASQWHLNESFQFSYFRYTFQTSKVRKFQSIFANCRAQASFNVLSCSIMMLRRPECLFVAFQVDFQTLESKVYQWTPRHAGRAFALQFVSNWEKLNRSACSFSLRHIRGKFLLVLSL